MLTQPFQIENHRKENKNRAAGMIVSVLIHTVLLLCLYFIIIHTPDPPYEDNQGGMTVNYGTSAVGTGDQQQYTTVPITVQQQAHTAPAPQPATSSSQEDLETQNTEDAPVVEKKTETKKKRKPDPNALFTPTTRPVASAAPQPPKPTVDKNALFSAGAPGKPNRSKGDGEGGGQGDQGDPNGDPNSRNYHGGGTGNGIGQGGTGLGNGNVRLTGRKLRSRPPVKNPCETARGRVVISIDVNRDGRVVDTKFSLSGSTTSDDCLVATARQAAMKYTFDQNATASEIQTGSIVFIFKED
jgi:protein TonB